jgi:hypothetical protein
LPFFDYNDGEASPIGISDNGKVFSRFAYPALGGPEPVSTARILVTAANGTHQGLLSGQDGWHPIGSHGHSDVSGNGWLVANTASALFSAANHRLALWNPSQALVSLPAQANGFFYPLHLANLDEGQLLIAAGTQSGTGSEVFLSESGTARHLPSLTGKNIRLFAGDGTGMTSDGKLWRNGKLIPMRDLCQRWDELLDGGWNLEALKANKFGVYLIQATHPQDAEPRSFILPPVEIQVRTPTGGPWMIATELKVAKWEKAWNSLGEFRNDFIDSVGTADIDRFRILVKGPLPEDQRSFFISSTGSSEQTYNDTATEMILTEDPGFPTMGIPSAGFVSKEMILVADAADNRFLNDNLVDDQTHIVALGSDVELRHGTANGSPVAKTPVKKKATVDITSYILTPNGGIDFALVERAYDDIRIAREIYTQIALEITGTVQCVPIPEGVDLNDGLLLDTLQTLGTLSTEALAVLETYGTPADHTDVIAIYVDSVIQTAQTASGTCLGMAFPKGWSNAGNFKGTYLVTFRNSNPIVWSHELGHILLNSQGGNHNNHYNIRGNLMRGTTVYTDLPTSWSHTVDTKRINREQEGYVFESEFIELLPQ